MNAAAKMRLGCIDDEVAETVDRTVTDTGLGPKQGNVCVTAR